MRWLDGVSSWHNFFLFFLAVCNICAPPAPLKREMADGGAQYNSWRAADTRWSLPSASRPWKRNVSSAILMRKRRRDLTFLTLWNEDTNRGGLASPWGARVIAGIGLISSLHPQPARQRRPVVGIALQVDVDRTRASGWFASVHQRPAIVKPNERRSTSHHLMRAAAATDEKFDRGKSFFFCSVPYRGQSEMMRWSRGALVITAAVGLWAEVAMELDIALGFDVVLAALGHVGHRRPDQQLDKVRHLALATRNLRQHKKTPEWATGV